MSVQAPEILRSGHDSAKFKEQPRADPALPTESEGGWLITRAQYTRQPPIMYTLGFTDISDEEKNALQKLYNDTRGGSEIITSWLHPISGKQIPVRFKQGSMPQYTYRGKGGNHRWDVSSVILEEV